VIDGEKCEPVSNGTQVSQFLGDSEALFFRALYVGEKCNWIEEVMQVY